MVTRVLTSEVFVPTHAALRMFIMQVLANQMHFLTNRNAGLAIPPLFWPVNCIKMGGTCCTAKLPYCSFPKLLSYPSIMYSLHMVQNLYQLWTASYNYNQCFVTLDQINRHQKATEITNRFSQGSNTDI